MKMQYLRLTNGDPMPPPGGFGPCKAVVIVEDIVEPGWQGAVSKWLVQSGCLYMMAWGKECGSWDDSVDWANIDDFGAGEIPDERFVMTTWHEKESLREVLWYAKYAAHHPEVELDRLLLLQIGGVERPGALTELFNNV